RPLSFFSGTPLPYDSHQLTITPVRARGARGDVRLTITSIRRNGIELPLDQYAKPPAVTLEGTALVLTDPHTPLILNAPFSEITVTARRGTEQTRGRIQIDNDSPLRIIVDAASPSDETPRTFTIAERALSDRGAPFEVTVSLPQQYVGAIAI